MSQSTDSLLIDRPNRLITSTIPFPLIKQVNPLTVQLKLDAGEQPGAIHAFDLVQRDEAGAVVGGARFLVILTS